MDNTYNGWRNRETWLVNIWFNPENQDDLDCAKEALDAMYDELPSVMKDFCAIQQIDWDELKVNVVEDDEDEDPNNNQGDDNE
jgi:hypothetical protein